MSSLGDTAAQILDKLAELVTGPVQGTLTATTAAGTVLVPQGQMATLPGGRRIRVTKATRVGTTPTTVPVRLEFLSPSYPAANNFAAVAAGTTATWVAPPAGLTATATTSAFAPGPLAGTLKVAGVIEADDEDLPGGASLAAGQQGTVALYLIAPDQVSRLGPESITQRFLSEARRRLRAVFAELAHAKDGRVRSRELFDAIVACAQGAAAGNDSDVIRLQSWNRLRNLNYPRAWEAILTTRQVICGRVLRATDEPFDAVDATYRLPEDAAQPDPFRVEDEAETGSSA